LQESDEMWKKVIKWIVDGVTHIFLDFENSQSLMFNETHCKRELEPSDWSDRVRICKIIYYWFSLLKAT